MGVGIETPAIVLNRAVVITSPGGAAIAVVRLLGPGVQIFLLQHFSRKPVIGRCVHGELFDGSRIIDDPVVVLISSEAADVNVHGGPWVIKSMLELAKADGFEILNSANDSRDDAFAEATTQLLRETLSHLHLARTELAVRLLLAQPLAWENLKRRAAAGSVVVEELQQIEQDRSLHWMLSLPKVAIVGPANVGKSTLANSLFGQERSITADLPGTTRDWVGEIANVGGLAVMLIDTAGRRATDDPIESAAIAAGNEQVGGADLVLVVLDRSAPLGPFERDLLSAHPRSIRIANKSDQPAAWGGKSMNAIETVATKGIGIERLQRNIREHFECSDDALDRPRCWTSRQLQIVARSITGPSALTEI
jgi:tRNA modification GTPase